MADNVLRCFRFIIDMVLHGSTNVKIRNMQRIKKGNPFWVALLLW